MPFKVYVIVFIKGKSLVNNCPVFVLPNEAEDFKNKLYEGDETEIIEKELV